MILGIDLGTINSLALSLMDGKAQQVPNALGGFPSTSPLPDARSGGERIAREHGNPLAPEQ